MITVFTMIPLVVLILNDVHATSDFIGMFATFINLLFFLAPCTVVIKVINTQDSASLFLPMLLANFLCSVCWFCYGLFGLNDIWIYAVNAIGALLQGLFIVLKLWYGDKSKADNTDEKFKLISP